MTELELKAIVTGIAPVVRAAMLAGLKDFETRLAAVEARPSIPGRDGVDGPVGPQGEKGLDGVVGPAGPAGAAGLAGPAGEPGPAGAAGVDGAQGPAGERGHDGPEGLPGRDGRDGLPGIPGLPGEKGLDGRHGIDGKDGLGFGDLVVEHDGERGFTLRAVNGDQVKELGTFTIPSLIYRGVWIDGKAYAAGDVVTWAGSTWSAKEATKTKPGEVVGAAHWVLCVKKGRDGRDGKDFTPVPVPVVKVGGR